MAKCLFGGFCGSSKARKGVSHCFEATRLAERGEAVGVTCGEGREVAQAFYKARRAEFIRRIFP